MKKKKTCFILIIIIILIITGSFFLYKNNKKEKKIQYQHQQEKTLKEISNHYNKYVITNKNTNIYQKENNKYKKIGTIVKDKKLILKEQKITKNTKYFELQDLNIFLSYKDVDKIDQYEINNRYKNYIPFNENIKTNDITNLYQDNNLIITINNSLDKEIIMKDELGYYVEYNNELYLVKNEDVKETYEKENSTSEIATTIPVTAYHFIYLENESCDEMICHPESQIREEFNYLKENNYFTLTTTELRLFMEKKINLPKKSILVTIDDGARAEKFLPLLDEYKINTTLFLVSSWYPKEQFASPYMEIASHTHNLHTPGVCPGGQGSPLKCLDKDKLQADLKASREYLNTEAFCFPFYEFNDYAIENLKEAGFKMAFIGGMRKATQNDNLFKIPRISIHKDTSLEQYIKYIN